MHEAAIIEVKDLLIGGRVDRVFQLDRYTFLVGFHSFGKNWLLLLSLRKSSQRFHLLFGQIHKFYLFSGAPADIMKKYMVGKRIVGMGLGSNSVELHFPGLRFVVDFLLHTFELLDSSGGLLYDMRSSGSGRRVAAKVPREDRRGRERVEKESDRSDGERMPLKKNAIDAIPSLTLNRSLSQEFFQEWQHLLIKQLLKVLKSEEKKLERLGEKLTVEKNEIEEKQRYKRIGESMKFNLDRIPKGARSWTFVDFEGREMNVELDPSLSPRENMNAYFQKYRKLKKRESVIEERLDDQKRKLGLVQRLIEEVQRDERTYLTHPPDSIFKDSGMESFGRRFLDRLKGVTGQMGRKHVQVRGRFLRLSSRSGKHILVGRSAAENEEITLRYARGNDLWFHAESHAGSHIILQYEGEGEFLEEDIIDAAQLALHFSALRKQGKGNILYTRRKYVRKPKGADSGMVIYHNEKTRWTTLDEKLIKKLLSAQELKST